MENQNTKPKIATRGERLQGIVVSAKAKLTAVVERPTVKFFPKFQKWAAGRSKITVHNPTELNAKVGDVVEISECRKISKTKAWVITQIIQKSGESS